MPAAGLVAPVPVRAGQSCCGVKTALLDTMVGRDGSEGLGSAHPETPRPSERLLCLCSGNATPQECCTRNQEEGTASHTTLSLPQTLTLVSSHPRPGQHGGAGAGGEVFLGIASQHLLFYNSTACLTACVGITRLSQGLPVATGTERAN